MRAAPSAVLEALAKLEAADKARRDFAESIPDLVAQAVQVGCTWAEIARALGTSKQNAWNRYGRRQP